MSWLSDFFKNLSVEPSFGSIVANEHTRIGTRGKSSWRLEIRKIEGFSFVVYHRRVDADMLMELLAGISKHGYSVFSVNSVVHNGVDAITTVAFNRDLN